MVTQIVGGRVYDWSRAVGRSGSTGQAFTYPVKAVVGEGDTVYVLSRGHKVMPNMPWNGTGTGVRVSKLIVGLEPEDEELLGEFGSYGNADNQIIWPAGLTLDGRDNYYVTDEWLNRVSIFDKNGAFLGHWGASGDGRGQLNGPAGICTDRDGALYIVNSRNHRVQRFSTGGEFLGGWGSFGGGEGQLNAPWGVGIDGQGNVYVADTKNHRVQKFTAGGGFVAAFGSYGTGRGQLRYPSDVCVDPDGDVYVADWSNDRVQLYAPDGRFINSFLGNAQVLSKWGRMTVEANPDTVKRRPRGGR